MHESLNDLSEATQIPTYNSDVRVALAVSKPRLRFIDKCMSESNQTVHVAHQPGRWRGLSVTRTIACLAFMTLVGSLPRDSPRAPADTHTETHACPGLATSLPS